MAQDADELAGRQRQFADARQRLLNERKGLEMAQEALEASLAEVCGTGAFAEVQNCRLDNFQRRP